MDSRVGGEAMWNSPTHYDIKDALDDISNKITVYDSLFIVIISHGGPESFVIRADVSSGNAEGHPDTQATVMEYNNFGSYLNSKFGTGSNRKYAVMVVVNQACYSGTMISHLSGENRILITAADSTHEAWTMASFYGEDIGAHWAFLYKGRNWRFDESHHGFILTMGTIDNPTSVKSVYDHGVDATNNNNGLPPSYPDMWYDGFDPNKVYW